MFLGGFEGTKVPLQPADGVDALAGEVVFFGLLGGFDGEFLGQAIGVEAIDQV